MLYYNGMYFYAGTNIHEIRSAVYTSAPGWNSQNVWTATRPQRFVL